MIYDYICRNCGFTDEKSLPASGFRKAFDCPECGQVLQRDLAAEQGDFRDTCSSWPMESDAAGVHPDQAKELHEYCEKMGVPTEINAKTGNPVFHSREHRKKFCRITNLYDRNAGIGDATPKHNMKRRDPNKQKQRRGSLIRALEGVKDAG